MVSLEAKFHVNVLFSAGEQLVAPSLTLPAPAAVKVNILSFLQGANGGSWLETSVELTKAVLNFQVLWEINCVFVFGGGLLSFVEQEEKIKRAVTKHAARVVNCFFICIL